jgi:VanZ family protein
MPAMSQKRRFVSYLILALAAVACAIDVYRRTWISAVGMILLIVCQLSVLYVYRRKEP